MTRKIRKAFALTTLLIVTFVSGCDNVEWGGIRVAVVRPARQAGEPETAASAGAERLPDNAVLFYVEADPSGDAGVVRPVAEIGDGTLLPLQPIDPERYAARFITRHFPRDATLTLYRRGREVGTFRVRSADLAGPDACRKLPVARGTIQVDPDDRAPEYLALARRPARQARPLPPETPPVDRRMRILAPMLAEELLESRNARLPQDWETATAQLQPFPVPDAADGAFTATILLDDTLGPGLDARGSSLFFVAVPQAQVGYDTVFVRYADYEARGKGAPRLVDFLDWNRDGSPELLLEVYDTAQSWFEAVGTRDGRWRLTLRDRCDARPIATQAPATAPPRTTTSTPRRRVTPTQTARDTTPPTPSIPEPQPRVELAGTRPAPRDTTPPPDTGGAKP